MNNLNIALVILIGFWVVIAFLNKQGILERHNISAFGPILMVRTRRGQKLLTVLARPRRFWRFFANVGVPMMLIGMFIMFVLIILTDYAMLKMLYDGAMIPSGKYNAPQNIFLIPGVNEFIPLVWGAIGLLVTLVVHELAHAILCRVEGIGVKSMGALLLGVIPIGGFAEPDEVQLFGKKEETGSAEPGNLSTGFGYDRAIDHHPNDETAEQRREGDAESTISTSTVSTVSTVSTETTGATASTASTASTGAPRSSRIRILVAGVMANFVVALIAFALFFGPALGGIAPASNVAVVSVDENSSAAYAGIKEGMVITKVDNVTVTTAHDFYTHMSTRPDAPLVMHTRKRATSDVFHIDEQDAVLQKGVVIWEVLENSSAAQANITKGATIMMINDTKIGCTTDFIAFLNTTAPNQTIVVFFEGNNSTMVELGSSPDRSSGYMGVVATTKLEFAGMSIGEYPAAEKLHILKKIPSMMDRAEGWIIIFVLPFVGFDGSGFSGFGEIMQFYEPVGWAADYGVLVFWIASALLWIGWINFYAGLFNCLPAVPLDGGHVFKDIIHSFFGRVVSDHGAEQLSRSIAVAFAVLILASFVFMIFGPVIVELIAGFS